MQLAEAVSVQQARSAVDAWTAQFQDDRAAYRAQRDADAVLDTALIQPSGLFKTLRDVLPAEAAFTMDAGTLCLQATDAMMYVNGGRCLRLLITECTSLFWIHQFTPRYDPLYLFVLLSIQHTFLQPRSF